MKKYIIFIVLYTLLGSKFYADIHKLGKSVWLELKEVQSKLTKIEETFQKQIEDLSSLKEKVETLTASQQSDSDKKINNLKESKKWEIKKSVKDQIY